MKDKDAAVMENRRISKAVDRIRKERADLPAKQKRKSTAEQLALVMAQHYREGDKQMVLDMLTHGRHAVVYLSARIVLDLHQDQMAGEFLDAIEHKLGLGKGQK